MTKTCRNCGELPAHHFYASSRRLLCKACQNEARRLHALVNVEQARATRRRGKLKSYGLTPEDYDRMVNDQNGKCAICLKDGDTDPTSQLRLGVDHDHATGRVRGLLCRPCNRAIGILEDSPERAQRMADYLTTTASVAQAPRA